VSLEEKPEKAGMITQTNQKNNFILQKGIIIVPYLR
jgi:hypothetical protein